jgi:hypothetical protein
MLLTSIPDVPGSNLVWLPTVLSGCSWFREFVFVSLSTITSNLHETHINLYIDFLINNNNKNKYSLRINTKGYSGKTHSTDPQNSDTTAPSGRLLYHLQLSLQAASPETFGYTFVTQLGLHQSTVHDAWRKRLKIARLQAQLVQNMRCKNHDSRKQFSLEMLSRIEKDESYLARLCFW